MLIHFCLQVIENQIDLVEINEIEQETIEKIN